MNLLFTIITLILAIMSALNVITYTLTEQFNRRKAILSFIASVILFAITVILFQYR